MAIPEKILPHYQHILDKNIPPNYIQTKHTPVTFKKTDSLETLWKIHNKALQSSKIHETIPTQSLLDLKLEIAKKIFTQCHFCEHRCNINREKTTGICNVGTSKIASTFHHMGEESILIPSYTVFFSGCNFSCIYCQNYDISQQQNGIAFEPKQFANYVISNIQKYAKNINWVGGDPTPNVLFILQTLKHINLYLPQIWNSNMYCTDETMQLLNGIIDVYLTDFKYGNDLCAEQLSNIPNYFHTISRNHLIADKQCDVLIRHLVLPGHVTCCSKPIIKWIATHLKQPIVNIMDQYHPTYKASNNSQINRTLSSDEYAEAISCAKQFDIILI